MSGKLLIFGGTFEGRTLCERLSAAGMPADVCTATAYGSERLTPLAHITVHSRRLDAGEMLHFIRKGGFVRVIDATHPYAREVTENIREACGIAEVEYIRLLREEKMYPTLRTVESVAAAVEFLAGQEGRVLVTTGSRNLAAYCRLPDWSKRLFIRVLPSPEVMAHCYDLGFTGDHIIAMQGPFSQELNAALLRQFDCAWLVTKNTGIAGGMEEKIAAAQETGAKVLIVDRPMKEAGLSLVEVLNLLGLSCSYSNSQSNLPFCLIENENGRFCEKAARARAARRAFQSIRPLKSLFSSLPSGKTIMRALLIWKWYYLKRTKLS